MISATSRFRVLRRTAAYACMLAIAAGPAAAQQATPNWADKPANLSIAEYLELLFKQRFARTPQVSVQSFNLVSFVPSASPDSALLFIVQTWRDIDVTADQLRASIQRDSDLHVELFQTILQLPQISSRWKPPTPKDAILIRHVPEGSRRRETIAVTLGGVLRFDDVSIAKAQALVRARGAVWFW